MTPQTTTLLPQWVLDAAQLPVAFAQVREDALIDLSLIDHIGGNDLRVMMIASGGCIAAALAASNRLAHLHLVDVNPAQMALCRLKLHLLEDADRVEKLRVLGHADMPDESRAAWLRDYFASFSLSSDVLGPLSLVAGFGPDRAGRYERVFAELQAELKPLAGQWMALLNTPDAAGRASLVDPRMPLGRNLDEAFDRVMALPNLVRLFGVDATRNSCQPFSRHFAVRTRHAIANLSTHDNPYLWQLLIGRFPGNAYHPWLDLPSPKRMPDVTEHIGSMDSALSSGNDRFDFIHLSNILDWLAPQEARKTLSCAAQRIRAGGYLLIRQLNSTLDIPSLNNEVEWLVEDAAKLHARDRSFFYRQLHLGRRR